MVPLQCYDGWLDNSEALRREKVVFHLRNAQKRRVSGAPGLPPQQAKTGLAGDPGLPPQQAKTGLAGDPGGGSAEIA